MHSKIIITIVILSCTSPTAFAAPVLDREKLVQEVGALFAART